MLSSVLMAGLIAATSVVSRALPVRDTAFGSCTNPAIIFANGLDGRNQPSFEPANESDFNHGSALGIAVITSFICQQLNDKCKASAAQITACNAGAKAAAALTGQAAADAFNSALGVSAGTTTGSTSTTTTPTVASPTSTTSASTSAAPTTTSTSVAVNTGSLTFGKCTNPSVIFGAGLAGRSATEFSFEPADLTQFNHGTALNPDIIFQFVCDNLVNNCGLTNADAVVIKCRAAQQVADGFGHTGAAADSFNGALGFVTNFAALDSQLSTTIGASTTAATPATTTSAAVLAVQTTDSTCPPASTVTVEKTKTLTVTSAPTATTTGAPVLVAETTTESSVCVASTTTVMATVTTTGTSVTSTSTPAVSTVTSSTLSFGKCTNPSVIFGAGLAGRSATEFSFEPADLTQFNHGTALNPDIIFQFVCDNLVNNCGLTNADAVVIKCRAAQQVADGFGHTGAAADSFNGALGFSTHFAALDTNATTTAGKRSLKRKPDPRVALKEMTQFAKKHGFSAARYIK